MRLTRFGRLEISQTNAFAFEVALIAKKSAWGSQPKGLLDAQHSPQSTCGSRELLSFT